MNNRNRYMEEHLLQLIASAANSRHALAEATAAPVKQYTLIETLRAEYEVACAVLANYLAASVGAGDEIQIHCDI